MSSSDPHPKKMTVAQIKKWLSSNNVRVPSRSSSRKKLEELMLGALEQKQQEDSSPDGGDGDVGATPVTTRSQSKRTRSSSKASATRRMPKRRPSSTRTKRTTSRLSSTGSPPNTNTETKVATRRSSKRTRSSAASATTVADKPPSPASPKRQKGSPTSASPSKSPEAGRPRIVSRRLVDPNALSTQRSRSRSRLTPDKRKEPAKELKASVGVRKASSSGTHTSKKTKSSSRRVSTTSDLPPPRRKERKTHASVLRMRERQRSQQAQSNNTAKPLQRSKRASRVVDQPTSPTGSSPGSKRASSSSSSSPFVRRPSSSSLGKPDLDRRISTSSVDSISPLLQRENLSYEDKRKLQLQLLKLSAAVHGLQSTGSSLPVDSVIRRACGNSPADANQLDAELLEVFQTFVADQDADLVTEPAFDSYLASARSTSDLQHENVADLVARGETNRAWAVLQSAPARINETGTNGRTAMMNAVDLEIHSDAAQQLNVVKSLLRFWPDLGLFDDQGDTVLHIAVRSGFVQAVPMLLRYGALCCVDEANNIGHTPVSLAREGCLDLVSLGLADYALCTFVDTKREFAVQPFYECSTCEMGGKTGCCDVCALKCHKSQGHDVRPMEPLPALAPDTRPLRDAYCDCGDLGPGLCNSLIRQRSRRKSVSAAALPKRVLAGFPQPGDNVFADTVSSKMLLIATAREAVAIRRAIDGTPLPSPPSSSSSSSSAASPAAAPNGLGTIAEEPEHASSESFAFSPLLLVAFVSLFAVLVAYLIQMSRS